MCIMMEIELWVYANFGELRILKPSTIGAAVTIGAWSQIGDYLGAQIIQFGGFSCVMKKVIQIWVKFDVGSPIRGNI